MQAIQQMSCNINNPDLSLHSSPSRPYPLCLSGFREVKSFLYLFTHSSPLFTHIEIYYTQYWKKKRGKRGCVISLWRTLFVFSPFSRYGTEKIVFIYNKAQTFTSSGFAFPQKICIFAENFFKYGKDTNKI